MQKTLPPYCASSLCLLFKQPPSLILMQKSPEVGKPPSLRAGLAEIDSPSDLFRWIFAAVRIDSFSLYPF